MSTMFECEPFPDIVVGEDLNVDLSFYIGATTVNMSIPLKQGQNLSSSLRRVFQQHHVPIYLESSLLSVARDVVLNAMNAKQQQPGISLFFICLFLYFCFIILISFVIAIEIHNRNTKRNC